MKLVRFSRRVLHGTLLGMLGAFLTAVAVFVYVLDARPDLHPWHTVVLQEEFSLDKQAQVQDLDDYLALEDRLFNELQSRIYHHPLLVTGPERKTAVQFSGLNRFENGSLADPAHYAKNWTRSSILAPEKPRGGVLLLHGLSDSPYSLRQLAQTLYRKGYYVIGLRLPGHGTAPSALLHIHWEDMAAVVRLAMRHLAAQLPSDVPVYITGYSMGAAQAVNYSLDALKDKSLPAADALVLISPAIAVPPIAALAIWQARLGVLFGLEKLAWNSIGPEYDPYKYNSFAVNAGDQMFRLTQAINSKLDALAEGHGTRGFPPSLAIVSMVDATVSAPAVVSKLLDRLENPGNQLVLFDINRHESLSLFIKKDPMVDFLPLFDHPRLNYDLKLLTNAAENLDAIIARRRYRGQAGETKEPTDMRWPQHLYSLSHVALPFPPGDSLYGSRPDKSEGLHIGLIRTKGEKGVLNIMAADLLRLRYNPFYGEMEEWILGFMEGDIDGE